MVVFADAISVGCGSGTVYGSAITGALPSITSTSPASAIAGGKAFPLTVNGSGFLPGATVNWNGSGRTTTFVNSTQLAASITSADIVSAETANIAVVNPPPGGGTSIPFSFPINSSGTGAAGGISIVNSFSPNAVTISTSEGAPYGNCDFWVQTAASCSSETNFGYGPTRVMRLYICLTGEVAEASCSLQPAVTGPVSAQMLSDLDARLSAYQGTGMRVIPRFIYNFGPIGPTAQDAPLSVISTHISQLAPVVLKYQDLVFALEAGFIGTWGEWHDSTNGNDSAAAHLAVLNQEIASIGGRFPILVRYPGDLIQYTGGLTPPSGFGLHDDYYASASDDAGTWDTCVPREGYCLQNYSVAQFQSFAAQVSTTTIFAGEFGALYPNLQTCSALDAYSYTYHPQSISLHLFPATIATELQNENCALSFFNKVGTRIELQQATITGTPSANGQIQITLTMANTGYGRVVRPRPAIILLLAGNTIVAQSALPLATLDVTQLASSATPVAATFQATVSLTASLSPGQTISAVVFLPDPAPSLSSQAAYALPLNSVDANGNSIFNPATGYNVVGTFVSQ